MKGIYRVINYNDDRQMIIFNKNQLIRPRHDVTFTNVPYRKNVKFGVLRHAHYSGYVYYSTLINYIKKHKKDFYLEKSDENSYLFHYINGGKYNVSNITDSNLDNVWCYITNIWSNYKDLNELGQLFYFVIKNMKFLPIYCDMIINQMTGVDFATFRIKLGSHFYFQNNKKISICIEDEIDMLRKYSKGKFNIIAQFSKISHPKAFEKYFYSVLSIINKKRYRNFIIAFDLVGHEEKIKANTLNKYNKGIFRKYEFRLHAGETEGKGEFNLKYILDNNIGKNIGHGIVLRNFNHFYQNKAKYFNFELTPYNYVYTKLLTMDELYDTIKFMSHYRINISPDDPNKMQDAGMSENFKLLRQIGFTLREVNKMRFFKHKH
jgi:hypothetical protein